MKTIIRLWIYVAMFLLAPTWARGQDVPPESVEVRVVINDESGNPPIIASRETAIMPGGSRCGQPKTGPNSSLTNPSNVAMDDPFAGASLDCVVPLPIGIPDGMGYVAYALYRSDHCPKLDGTPGVEPCMSGWSNFTQPFSVAQGPPPDPCAGAVVLSIGDWTRQAPARTLARVTYSLLKSQHPVTKLIVKLNGVVQDNLTANDLTRVAGSYFLLPPTPGNYSLTVEAQDANGCSDGSNRPMTVVVQ